MKRCRGCNRMYYGEDEDEMEDVYCFIHKREESFCPICVLLIEGGENDEHKFSENGK
ncbi:MAG: hypothetical protein QXL94_01945 [Candidatus Parvarchaeum sp.]